MSVAPQVAPRLWLLRCVALVALSWTATTILSLVLFLVPLSLGRLLFRVAQVPLWLVHDPLCFMVGCIMCASAATLVAEVRKMDVGRHVASLWMLPPAVILKGQFDK